MYTKDKKLYVARASGGPVYLQGKMANRHGLIAGATGTGKTVSLQVMAETFSQAGKMTPFIEKRAAGFGIPHPEFRECPVRFFDVYGIEGHPVRAAGTIGRNIGNSLVRGILGSLFKK